MKYKILKIENLDEIIFLINFCYEKIENKNTFIKNDKKFFENVLKNNLGVSYGVYDKNILIGYSLLLFEENEYTNFGNGSILDITIVHPDYQNKGIHKKCIKLREKIAKDMNKDYLITTVHPENIPCLNNFINLDYNIMDNIHKKDKKKFVRKVLFKIL